MTTAQSPPIVDPRTYAEIRDELIRRIPLHDPQWTDHNAGDPGITLIELMAWLGHDLQYRINRVPERVYEQFLTLLGVPRRPASAARALLRIRRTDRPPVPEAVFLDYGAGVRPAVFRARNTLFEASGPVTVLPVDATAAIKARAVLPADTMSLLTEGLRDLRLVLRDHLGTELPGVDSLDIYRTQSLPPPTAGVPLESIDLRTTVDGFLWIALLGPESLARVTEPVAREAALGELRSALAGQALSLGIRFDESLCGPEEDHCCDETGCLDDLKMAWQVSTGLLLCDEPRVNQLHYAAARVEMDETAGFQRTGIVHLRLPQDPAQIGTWDPSLFGNRDLEGTGDLPPAFDEPQRASRVVAWLRCEPPAGANPCIEWLEANVVRVEQLVTGEPVALGEGTGRPNHRVRLPFTPVVSGTVEVEVESMEGWQGWQEVPFAELSGAADLHFTLDPDRGEICFGDGIHGRLLENGERIRARTYRFGGGAGGNVAAGAIREVERLPDSARSSVLKIDNPFAAGGGRDAETVEAARLRIPQVLRHRDRTVARDDFRDLALETPRAHVGRVEVLARHKIPEHIDNIPGLVTLIVLPAHDPLHPNEPTPDKTMLRRVCEWLAPRRLICTELCLAAPEYVPLWVSIALETGECNGIQALAYRVELAIRQHLAPLPPYGPSGAGWPFGRDVHDSDIASAALRVEGVRVIREVRLEGLEIDELGEPRERTDGTVRIRKWQLPAVHGVQITEGETAEAVDRGCECPPTSEPPVTLPVPVLQEKC